MQVVEMPEMFPGPHGRTLKVVAAIVKPDKHGEIATYRDRLPSGLTRTRRERTLIARCGNAGRGCRGIIGYPTSREFAFLHELGAHDPEEDTGDGWEQDWVLFHPDRYRGYPDSGYVVLSPERGRRALNGSRVGSKSVPRRLIPTDGEADVGALAAGDRAIVGQVPVLPALIFCPVCGTPNWVETPQHDPPDAIR